MRCPGKDNTKFITALLGVGVIVGSVIAAGERSQRERAMLPVSAAGWKFALQEPGTATPPMVAPGPTIGIGIDATQTETADSDALRTLMREVNTAQGGDTSESPTPNEPDWYVWGRLSAARARIRADAADALDLYGVADQEGATLCLVNRAARKTPTVARFRLPRGVYKIERLTFTPAPTASGANPNENAPTSAPADGPHARLDRLEGRDLSASGLVVKTYMLEPGQVCLYRCTDEAREARLARSETQSRLHALAASAPGPARRLRRILAEGDAYWSGLYGPSQRRYGSSRRLSCIHRLLLLVAQAQSLHHNYQRRGTVEGDKGAAVMGALERLSDALAETSSLLLGLVPQITVDASPPQTDAAQDGKDVVRPAMVPPPEEMYRFARVTVALADTGGADVGLVKIGLDTTALPPGVTCEPSDPAVFGTLRPGQTVRATFRLRYPVSPALNPNRCVGDISYFAAGAAAHLRPRLW